MPMDKERFKKYRNSEIKILSDPDEPLETFLYVFGIKRMLVINTMPGDRGSDKGGREHIIRFLKKYAQGRGLEYKNLNAKEATADSIRGEIEIVYKGGTPYHQRKKPAYWPEQKAMVVVEGVGQETDEEMLRAFLYVACASDGNTDNLPADKLPKGSGFVFLANGDFPSNRFAAITEYFNGEYKRINWPPSLYSKERVVYETSIALEDTSTLYQNRFINRKGRTRDESKELYTEVIAEELLKFHIKKKLEKLKFIPRDNYKRDTHRGITHDETTGRDEEILAKELFSLYEKGTGLGVLGNIFDYQVPLKSVKDDKAGKIDLVSFNPQTNTVWLLEFKHLKNKETLLRCILEIATYYQQLHMDNFLASYSIFKGLTPQIRKAVLVFKDGEQHKEIEDMKTNKRPQLKELAELLETSFFLISGPTASGSYTVIEITP